MKSLVLPAALLKRRPHESFEGDGPIFQKCHPSFDGIIGKNATLKLLAKATEKVFHEAGVWYRANGEDKIFITSNILQNSHDDSRYIAACTVTLPKAQIGSQTSEETKAQGSAIYEPCGHYMSLPNLPVCMANGATRYKDGILVCSQGQQFLLPEAAKQLAGSEDFIPSSLLLIDPKNFERAPQVLVNNFYGRVFNSLNDVFVHEQSGCILFTDPDYGFEQGFKAKPMLPNAVWSFNPKDGSIRMIADGIGKPNGVVCPPGGMICYVTDTDFIHGDGSMDGTRPGSIYAYDVVYKNDGHPTLQNKRLFAFIDCGAPDGIKCDIQGNVYTGCFDGVHIFDPQGSLLGRIVLPRAEDGSQRGCANLVFGPDGRLVILSETTVWEVQTLMQGALGAVQNCGAA